MLGRSGKRALGRAAGNLTQGPARRRAEVMEGPDSGALWVLLPRIRFRLRAGCTSIKVQSDQ